MLGFDKIESAQSLSGGNYLRDGRYPSLVITNIAYRKGFKGEAIIVEMLVDAEPVATEDTVKPNAKGSTVSTVFNLEQIMGPINARGFVLALWGLDEAKLKPGQLKELLEQMTSKDNPCRGMRITCDTYRKVAQKSGKTLILPNWHTYQQDAALVKATRAELDEGVR